MLQQGRDNALQAYIEYRALAGLGTATGWTSLSNIGYSILGDLDDVYTNVDEIDLLLGMWAEDKIDSAYVGKTQGCKNNKLENKFLIIIFKSYFLC